MKKLLIGMTVALFIIIDIVVLLYPTVSDYFNSYSQSRVVVHYYDEIAGMSDDDIQAILEAAHAYNAALLHKQNRFVSTEEETLAYNKQLNAGRSVMGILVIDKIDVRLPIYHGTDEGVLQAGLGHIQGTSLPVGGKGTHAFITGHRGLPSSTLLTQLDKMVEGDTFVLHIMGETLTYRVDQILIVEPWEIEALTIDPEQDYCTLVTCTPYGINSHRMLIRGCRDLTTVNVNVDEYINTSRDGIYSEVRRLDKFLVIFMFMIPILPLLMIYLIIRCWKIHKKGMVHQ